MICGISFLASMILTGCSKEKLTDFSGKNYVASIRSTYTFPGLSLSDGVIHISSNTYFDSLCQAVSNDSSVIDDFHSIFSTHFSHWHSFRQLIKDTTLIDTTDWSIGANRALYKDVVTFVTIDDTLNVEPTITSEIFTHLANADGLVVLCDTVYKITHDTIFAFSTSYLSSWESYASNPGSIPGVVKSEIQRTDFTECKRNYSFGSRKLQVTGEWSKEKWGIYNEFRVTTKHRRKLFGIWWYYDTKQLFHDGQVKYCFYFDEWGQPISPITKFVEIGKSNASKLTSIIVSTGENMQNIHVLSPSSIHHQAKSPDNVWRGCTITY